MKDIVRLVAPEEIAKTNYSFYGVESVVLSHDNKILLQQRGENWDKFPGYLTSFGGGIEQNETPEAAIIRELNEELGAQVDLQDLIKLGVVTEAGTNHTELIYIYFWRDLKNTITGCYEGDIRYFDNIEEIFANPNLIDSTRWSLHECIRRKLL